MTNDQKLYLHIYKQCSDLVEELKKVQKKAEKMYTLHSREDIEKLECKD